MWWRVFVFAGLLLVLGGTLEGCRRGPHLPSPPPVPTPTPVEVVTPPILATPSPTPVPLPSPSPTFSTTPTPTPHSLPKQGGILRTAQMGSPPTCDLRTYEGRSYLAVFPCSPMLNQLAKYTHQEQIAPDLAEGWEVQGGGKIWVFRLRDAQWHDGKPVTAEDVQYSLATVLTPPEGMRTGAPSTLRPYIAQIETPDPKTVVFRLKFPAPSFLPNLASVYVSIYAKHILTHMVPPTPSTPDYVVGSGPFQFRRWLPGSFIELERNPRYFLKDRPYLDGYTIYFIPDALSRFAALRTRQIDMLMADSMARGEVEEVLGHPRLREQISVESHPSNTFATLQVNTRSAHPTPPTGETVDWRDIRLRQAVNLAIDRYVVRTALYGDMGAFGSLLPPYSPWGLAEEEVLRMPGMAPTGPTKEAERTQARALLAQAGFPNGFSVTLLAPDLPTSVALAQTLQAQLQTVGITAKLVIPDSATFSDLLSHREFALLARFHTLPLFDPDAALGEHYTCEGRENYPGLCDPLLEDLFQRQQREMDPAQRKEVVLAFQRRYQELVGKMVLVWGVRHTAWWTYVKGWRPGPLYQQQPYSRVEEVWLGK